MGATKLCQNSHLIRTSEWKLRICAISTVSSATSPSFPPFSQYFVILQIHRLDISMCVPCSSVLCLPQHSMEPLIAIPGFLWPPVQLLRNPEKSTLAFPRCISRNKAFQKGYTALALPERCSGTHMRI